MEKYRGYDTFWRDWVGQPGSLLLHGIWAAKKPDQESFCYAVVPFGSSGVARSLFHTLDISMNNNWAVCPVTIFSDEELREHWKSLGWEQLKTAVDNWIDVMREKLVEQLSNYQPGNSTSMPYTLYSTSGSGTFSNIYTNAGLQNALSNQGQLMPPVAAPLAAQQMAQSAQQSWISQYASMLQKKKKP